MPVKGTFTQTFCVLLGRPTNLDEIEPLLTDFSILKRSDTCGHWEFGGPSLVLDYRQQVNGLVSLDVVDRPWPDGMGGPEEPNLFGAWGLGHFGPLTFPGNLERAAQHDYQWPEGREVSARHRAFLRARLSYSFGASPEALLFPPDYDALPEIAFMTNLALALLKLPSALCYFNPGGEVLASRELIESTQAHYAKQALPPLDVWLNRRMFRLPSEWMVMDTVGLGQFDRDDLEIVFRHDQFNPGQIASMLVNLGAYLIRSGSVIRAGETVDGPGSARFRAKPCEESLLTPPRPTLRFRPVKSPEPPPEFGFPAEKKSWQFWKR